MQNPTQNKHLQKPYLAYINGPILFTAPHSKNLIRGGPAYNQDKRVHPKEIYTPYIAAQLASLTGKNSFCVWGYSAQTNDDHLDPNYLKPQMFQKSPFHQALQYWALKNKSQPMLHVDVHGKTDRKHNCEIDIGMMPSKVHWKNDPIIQEMNKFFQTQLQTVFSGHDFLGFECKINTDPMLHGYWGGSWICTMTEQAALLNIPTFQLELPRAVREKLFHDEKMMGELAKVIKKLYEEVVVKWKQPRVPKLEIKYLSLFKPTIYDEKDRKESVEELKQLEEKESAKKNVQFG